ncbi:MAG: DNA-processing protein DprA [Bacteroidales bacterium]|nr:DNA-processing protein DprA [Bacteroidales bacterium]
MLNYQIALTLIPGIGDVTAKKLVAYCGSAEAVFREKKSTLLRIPGIGKASAESVAKHDVLKRAEEEIRFIQKHRIKCLYYLSKEYPARLKNCIDSPVMLYFIGNADLNHPRIISVVGTRKATPYGKLMCEKLITELGDLRPLVLSGLAYGIDTCAHREALRAGLPTTGVLAHGLDRIYPHQNKTLAARMTEQGGLLTDFVSGTNPDRENFPKRNRIIAGLCDALLVVESAISGGALITANIANSYNRDVFAVPGKVGDPFSEGCNFLIKTNKAALAASGDDIKYLMGWDTDKPSGKSRQTKLFRELTPEEEKVFGILRENGNTCIDSIVMSSGFSPTKTASLLLNLEFEGLVQSLPGKVYGLSR